jgi:c-di-GMP-related signal transduction protein
MPAPDAPGCREIIIDHASGGNCILDIPQHLLKNAKLTVLPNKWLVIPSDIKTMEKIAPAALPNNKVLKEN